MKIAELFERNPRWKKGTITKYITCFRKVYKILEGKKTKETNIKRVEELTIPDLEKVEKAVSNHSSRETLILVIKKLYEDDKESDVFKWCKEKATLMYIERTVRLEQQKKTEDEEKNWATVDEIKGMVESLADLIKPIPDGILGEDDWDNILNIQDFAMWSIYLQVPMRLDLADARWSNSDPSTRDDYNKFNWIQEDGDGYVLHLRVFKTSEQGDIKPIVLEGIDLMEALDELWEVDDRGDDEEFVFFTETGKKLGRGSLSSRFTESSKKWLNKTISNTLFRKIMITDKMKDEPSIAEKKEKKIEHFQKFQNSLQVADKVYRKLEPHPTVGMDPTTLCIGDKVYRKLETVNNG